jgi:hypothetical protein
MPTAVEKTFTFEYGGNQGFEYGAKYAGKIRLARGIPATVVSAIVARGRGTSVGAGLTLYSDDWSTWNGQQWQLFVLTLGNTVVTCWAAQGYPPSGRIDFRQGDGASSQLPAVQLRFFGEGGQQYYLLSRGPVAFSIQLENFVIADFAGDGSVRGIEIVGKHERTLESYVAQAVSLARDAASGLSTGKSQWKPVQVTSIPGAFTYP